jgi:hypothetical protein
MRSIFFAGLVGVGLVGSFAAAQDSPQSHDPDAFHTDRTGRLHDPHWHTHLFKDVREDVKHVEHVTWPEGKDQYRLSKTEDELTDLQSKLEARMYDEAELDRVIGVLSKVVADNRMEFRDRDMLNEDLSNLRKFRKHHEEWSR